MPYERKTIDLLISDKLRKVLKVIESESVVAKLLLKKRHYKKNLVKDPVNYISISNDDRSRISYLNENRKKSIMKLLEDFDENIIENELWNNRKRYHAKPGSFVGKIFKDISPKDVEIFSNLFRSESNKPRFNLKVFKGEDIRKLYNGDRNYSDNGSLGVSCMKYDSCQNFFNIYTENEENVSMLVMLNENNLVLGRAILWEFDGHKIMDRIYASDDEKYPLYFKKWATKNGYLYKSEQNYYNTLFFENMDKSKKELKLKIDLKNKNFYNYPYLDTFKFIDSDGILYNYHPENIDFKTLSSTNGEKLEMDYLVFDDLDKVFNYKNDSVYVDYLDINTNSKNVSYSNFNEKYILNKDSKYDDVIGDYIFNDSMKDNNKDGLEEFRKRRKEEMKKYKEELNSSLNFSNYVIRS